jgi:hypothetical protein
MIESTIEGYGNDLAKENGFLHRKLGWKGRKSAPDQFYSRDDTGPFLVEYKRPGEEPTVIQAREHQRLRDHGTKVYIINSKKQCDEVFRARD